MNPPEASRILGVELTASREEIHEAYRRLASQHHPDHGGDAQAFARLKEACELLECNAGLLNANQTAFDRNWIPGVPPNDQSADRSWPSSDWKHFRRASLLLVGVFLLVYSGLPHRIFRATVYGIREVFAQPLPQGVSRYPSCPRDVIVDNCRMAKLTFVYEDGQHQFVYLRRIGNELIAGSIRPAIGTKQLKELRIGDGVVDREGKLGIVATFELIR